MIVSNGIGIEYIVDNKDTGINPSYFSFTYTESIHNILPTLNLKYLDVTGVSQELLNFCEGRTFTLKIQDVRFKEDEDVKSFDFVTTKEDRILSDNTDQVSINTENSVTAKHIFFNNDDIKSTSYNDTTSGIISDILSNYSYKFKSNIIKETDDRKIFYNPMKNDLDFIEDILIKEAYHVSETPMFCYIDSFNNFSYKSYSDMFNDKELVNIFDVSSDTEDFLEQNMIEDLKIVELGSEKLKKLRSRAYIYIDNNGDIVEESINIIQLLPKSKDNILPIIKHSDLDTSYYYIDDIGYEDEEANNVRGRFIYEHRDAFFLQRILINTTYNSLYSVGKNVKVSLHLAGTDGVVESIFYTSNYIIEVNSIVWDGDNKTASNVLVLSRCNFNIDDSAKIKNKLYK